MKKNIITTIIQGMIIGSANVIPGVSGGTFAIIMGILERILNAIKSFNKKAAELILSGKFKEFAAHTDLLWLAQLAVGMGIAIISLARIFEFLFLKYPVFIWSFFFGLIAVSVYFVGKTIKRWSLAVVLMFTIGAAIAIGVSMLSPGVENANPFYLFFCGMIAISSMILPGLSGSFMLIIMGNYELVAIHAINNLSIGILAPFALGCGAGLIAFSHFLAWLLKKYKDSTISLLTGFILGSLLVIWPWKTPVYKLDALGQTLLRKGEPVILKYDRFVPDSFNSEVAIAILLALLGGVVIWAAEKWAEKRH